VKFNQFFDKPRVVKKSGKQVISLGNESKEQALEKEIKDLNKLVGTLPELELKSERLEKRLRNKVEEFQVLFDDNEVLAQKVKVLQVELDSLLPIQRENKSLQGSLKEAERNMGIKNSSLEIAQKTNAEMQSSLNNLHSKVKELNIETDNKDVLYSNVHQELQNTKEHLQKFKKTFEEIEEKFLTTQVKYKEKVKLVNELSEESRYWRRVADSLEDERDSLVDTKAMLKEISEKTSLENTNQKGMNKLKDSEIQELQTKVLIMTKQITELVDHNRYLIGFNTDLKNELARPRFMSMSAIERTEGFKMPMGGSREHYLGHGKPTLLKFKTGGKNNDN